MFYCFASLFVCLCVCCMYALHVCRHVCLFVCLFVCFVCVCVCLVLALLLLLFLILEVFVGMLLLILGVFLLVFRGAGAVVVVIRCVLRICGILQVKVLRLFFFKWRCSGILLFGAVISLIILLLAAINLQ